MSRVLVTGGAGYIGSHAVRALAAAGHAVVVLDDLSAGHAAAVPAEVPLIRCAIHDRARVEEALKAHGIDAVMHFAAWLSVADSVGNPLGYYQNNVVGSLRLLEAMAACGVGRLVFSSTCAVYGEPDEVPIRETAPQRPINAYGETKLAVERLLGHLSRATGLRSVSLRYFNAAGADPSGAIGEAHDPEIHLVPLAIRAATGGDPLRVFGEDYPTPDGTCLRDYVHVSDLAQAHVLALAALDGGAPSAVYNVGTGEPHSVRQVIDAVGRIVGAPVQWTSGPRRPGDPARLFAAAERARAELGWRPERSDLETIVADAWRWHRRHPGGFDGPPGGPSGR